MFADVAGSLTSCSKSVDEIIVVGKQSTGRVFDGLTQVDDFSQLCQLAARVLKSLPTSRGILVIYTLDINFLSTTNLSDWLALSPNNVRKVVVKYFCRQSSKVNEHLTVMSLFT